MSHKLKYIFMVATAAICNGLLSIIIKLALNAGVPLIYLLISSACFGFLAFFLIALKSNSFSISRKNFIKLFAVGIILGLSAFAFTNSLNHLPASIAVILQFQFVWIGVLFDALFRRKKPHPVNILIIIAILIGTVLAADVFAMEESISFSPLGVFFGLLCAVGFASFVFCNDHVLPSIDWKTRSFCIMTGTLVFYIIVVLPYEIAISDISLTQNINYINVICYGLLMALFGYIITISFFAIGIPKIGSTLSSLINSFELPAAIIGAMLILNEQVSFLQWVGILLIVTSLIFKK